MPREIKSVEHMLEKIDANHKFIVTVGLEIGIVSFEEEKCAVDWL